MFRGKELQRESKNFRREDADERTWKEKVDQRSEEAG